MSQPLPQRRPLLFVGLLLLFILGTFLITFTINAVWHWPATVGSFIGESLLGLVTVFLLSRFRWWRVAGFRIPRYSPAIFCLLAPCFVLVNDANSIIQWWDVIPGRATTMSTTATTMWWPWWMPVALWRRPTPTTPSAS